MNQKPSNGVFEQRQWRAAFYVIDRLERVGFQAYVVGGAVRDWCIGRRVSDIDIATDAIPAEVLSLFPQAIPTAIQHGTVTIPLHGEVCEVTTFRTEGSYNDGRRPDTVIFGHNLTDDLARRDFTINAMALNRSGELFDPFDGRRDLENRLLRTVGPPSDRFHEDALRMLRAFRFAAIYTLDIEPGTLDAIGQNAQGIARISFERIGMELLKMSRGNWYYVLDSIVQSCLFEYTRSPVHALHHAFQVLLDHQPTVGDAHAERCPAFGDVETFALWFTLAERGEEQVTAVCKKVSLGKSFAQQAAFAVACAKQLWCAWRNSAPFFTPNDMYLFGRETLERAVNIVAWLEPGRKQQLARDIQMAMQRQPIWSLSDLALNGRDLLNIGVQGQSIGKVLNALVQSVLQGHVDNSRDALMARAKDICMNGG